MTELRRQEGFTLLEAIVALVVFTMGAVALYAWLGANVTALGRVEQRRQALAMSQSALDIVRRVNPMATPSGERRVGDVLVAWTSRPVEPPRSAVTQVGLPTIFQVGLYEMEVAVVRDGNEIDRFKVRQPGYRQVGHLEEE